MVGDIDTLTFSIAPTDATNTDVDWSTSDKGVVSVYSSGKIRAKKQGEAIIKVKTIDGEYTDSCIVTVKPKETSAESLSVHTKIYPNPFENVLNLELENEHQFETVEIYDVLGEKILSKQIKNDTKVLINSDEFDSSQNGILLLKLNGVKYTKCYRLIKH